jgi:hypothetical protein
MNEIIAIVGQTGSGKSTSIETLNPKETVLIGITQKAPPFRGWKKNYTPLTKEGGNYYVSADSTKIVAALNSISNNRPEIKTIILDDAQYLMSTEFMNRSAESGWQKFTDIAKHMWDVIQAAQNLRPDIKVFILSHDEMMSETYPPKRKIKTIGKLLDEKITLEGLFTIVLFTDVSKGKENEGIQYRFITNSDGTTTAKSPKGMFPELLIPNDLAYVTSMIDKYYTGE